MKRQVRLFSLVVGVSFMLTACKDLDLNSVTGFLNGSSTNSKSTSSTQSNLSNESETTSNDVSDVAIESSIRSDVSELYEKVMNFVEPKKEYIVKNKKSSKKKKKKKSNSSKVKGKKVKSSKKNKNK